MFRETRIAIAERTWNGLFFMTFLMRVFSCCAPALQRTEPCHWLWSSFWVWREEYSDWSTSQGIKTKAIKLINISMPMNEHSLRNDYKLKSIQIYILWLVTRSQTSLKKTKIECKNPKALPLDLDLSHYLSLHWERTSKLSEWPPQNVVFGHLSLEGLHDLYRLQSPMTQMYIFGTGFFCCSIKCIMGITRSQNRDPLWGTFAF